MFNNAIDHGIESPELRMQAGKPPEGTIIVRYGKSEVGGKKWIRILVGDDGGGINLVKLRAAAAARERQLPDDEVEALQAVFIGGVSTKSEVTEVSGQGIGMGALKAMILKARGKVRVAHSSSQGTEIEILLPDISLA
jgi:chemotaxis protein histidine kinase CheA